MGSRSLGQHTGRRLVVGLAAAALAAGALVPTVVAADTSVVWQAAVGASSKDEAVQVNAFLPRDITVDAGDTLQWNLRSGEFHTVTFLSGGTPPPLIIAPGGVPQINPVAAAPAGGNTYDGTGFVNSGLLAAPGATFSLQFTKAGSYPFLCLIHAGMAGVVHVQDAGAAYPKTQAQYDNEALVGGNHLTASGRTLEARTLAGARSSGAGTAVVGTGVAVDAGSLAVMRFLPGKLVIHAGQSVTWTNHDPETPHTITFGQEPGGGDPLGAFFPSGQGIDGQGPFGAGHATLTSPDETANSGFLGAGPLFGTKFTATFSAPGTYHFICALHDTLGMKGTIVVLP